MNRILLCLCGVALLGLCPMSSSASSERAWSSMLVSGTIDINPDGDVRAYRMDQAQKIPGIVLAVLKQTVPSWHFQLDTTRNVIAQTTMSVRVVAKPVAGGKMGFSVEGVDFGPPDQKVTDGLRYRSHPAPVYPQAAVNASASAMVYMILRVGRDGHVMDVAGEQVNFTTAVARSKRAELTKILVKASAAALRRWTFDVPTTGSDAASPYWLARAPIAFSLRSWGSTDKPPAYASWQPYVPGPRLPTPGWIQDQAAIASAPDAIPDDGITPLGNGLRLAGSGQPR